MVAVVREGREPAGSPARLRAEMDSLHGRLGALNKLITAANKVCTLAGPVTGSKKDCGYENYRFCSV